MELVNEGVLNHQVIGDIVWKAQYYVVISQ
jgi:hypothetical protein